MPALIVLSHLTLSTPDGRPLLSNINLTFGPERTGVVGRNGIGKSMLLAAMAGDDPPRSCSVSVQGTVALLRQSVQPQAGATVADLFGARHALAMLMRAEHGEATADELTAIDWSLDSRIAAALARVDLTVPLDTELVALSGGETTRAGLAALAFAAPDMLLLDEPTNNLDRRGRQAVIDLLAAWRGGAIVVSHDRELLEEMDAIVELTSLGATRYGGNWTHYRDRKTIELQAAEHDLTDAEKTLDAIARQAQRTAERSDRRNAAGARKGARGGLPKILLGARKSRAEASKGDDVRLAARQRTQAQDAAAAARARIEILQPLSIAVPPTGLAAGRTVLTLDRVTVGYGGAPPVIRDLSFAIIGPRRVAVVGPNGSGKTSLLRLIAGQLQPSHGRLSVAVDMALLDQHVGLLDAGSSILDNFMRLNPQSSHNACRAMLASFLFRADAALQIVDTLSGGQRLRAGLACVLGRHRPPPLLILDEPTNHLDIASIEAIEAGLTAYDGALLVVSHDETFLDNIGIEERLDLTEPARRAIHEA
ncbi:MAG: ABC-F family ATP-binding cassette domain-containing protein [Pseudomonadota bacterium]